MTDVHSKEKRSYNMSKIKGKNTKPELIVRKYLHSQGFRYLLHDKRFPGKPDIVLPKYKAVVNIHGCFWHKHDGCKYFVIPKTRTDWWLEKINKTVERDKQNESSLESMGWKSFVVWECELKGEKAEITLSKLCSDLTCLI